MKNRVIILFSFFLIQLFRTEPVFSFGHYDEDKWVKCDSKDCNKKWPSTHTIYYESKFKKSNYIIISLLGGPGKSKGFDGANTFQHLIGKIDVVFFNCPYNCGGAKHVPSAYKKDQHARIRSVIEYYKKKYKKKIILAGNSNGAVRTLGYVRSNVENQSLLNGIILSHTNLGNPGSPKIRWKFDHMNIPTLVIHHKKDFCNNTQPSQNKLLYRWLSKQNKNITKLVSIDHENSRSSSDCFSKNHKYSGSGKEFTKEINDFLQDLNKL